MSLSYEDLDSIVTQGEKLGIYFYMMTGGEPLMRKTVVMANIWQSLLADTTVLIDMLRAADGHSFRPLP